MKFEKCVIVAGPVTYLDVPIKAIKQQAYCD